MTIGTRLYTWLKGQHVGDDEFGNRYYHERTIPKARRRARWVVYRGKTEASKVPAPWHRWLHYTAENPPKTNKRQHDWEKPHLPNLTGTAYAVVPEGHVKKGARRYKVSADYEPWKP